MRVDPRPAFHYLAEDDEDEHVPGGLKHLVPRNAQGAQWTWKKVTVVVDLEAAEHVMPRRMFTEMSTKKQSCPRMDKGSKDQDGSTSRNMGSESSPSELLKDSYAKARGRLQT